MVSVRLFIYSWRENFMKYKYRRDPYAHKYNSSLFSRLDHRCNYNVSYLAMFAPLEWFMALLSPHLPINGIITLLCLRPACPIALSITTRDACSVCLLPACVANNIYRTVTQVNGTWDLFTRQITRMRTPYIITARELVMPGQIGVWRRISVQHPLLLVRIASAAPSPITCARNSLRANTGEA